MEFKGVTYQRPPLENEVLFADRFRSLPEDLKQFYAEVNGLIAFNGGLHIRGWTEEPIWHSLPRWWFGDQSLCMRYPELRSDDIPFAQDCLGDQYFLRLGTVWNLMTESGDIEDLELEFEDFIEAAIEDPVDFLSLEPLIEFLGRDEKLEPGTLLGVNPPFIINSKSYKLYPQDVMERMNLLHDTFMIYSGSLDKE